MTAARSPKRATTDALAAAYRAGQLDMRNRVWRDFRFVWSGWERKGWNAHLEPRSLVRARPSRGPR